MYAELFVLQVFQVDSETVFHLCDLVSIHGEVISDRKYGTNEAKIKVY